VPRNWEAGLVAAAATWAAVLLMLAAAIIARAGGESPPDRWRFVLLAFGAAPFAWALLAEWRAPAAAAWRGAVLGGAVVPAAVVTMISYLAALPSLVLLIAATALALRSAARAGASLVGSLMGTAAAAGMWALWLGGFVALFVRDDERCVTYVNGSSCSSDVVTASEAGVSLLLLLCATVLAGAILRTPRQQYAST
jgi:hypothetical protein